MARRRQSMAPQARFLFAQGASLEEIAASCGVSPRTVARWKAADEIDWDAARLEYRRKDPAYLLSLLEGLLLRAAEEPATDGAAQADRIQKLSNVIEKLRARMGDLSITLGVLTSLAEWARENLVEDDVAVLRRAVDGYISDLKRRAL